MFLISLTLLLAASPAPAPVDHSQHVQPAKAEKKVCKRFGASESRMGAKRICKTAAEWKRMERGGEIVEVESTRAGRSSAPSN